MEKLGCERYDVSGLDPTFKEGPLLLLRSRLLNTWDRPLGRRVFLHLKPGGPQPLLLNQLDGLILGVSCYVTFDFLGVVIYRLIRKDGH